MVGGGLAGLAAASELVRSGQRVYLFEASDRLGGQVETELVDGYVIEHGAEGFPSGRRALTVLKELELTGRPIRQIQASSLVWHRGRLSRLPSRAAAGVLGIPVAAEVRRSGETGGVAAGTGLVTFGRGLGMVVAQLADRLQGRSEIRAGDPVTAIRRATQGWIVATGERGHHAVDSVVVAAPPRAAARLLRPLLAAFADLLDPVVVDSSVSVSLAFPRSAIVHALDATGFVVGAGQHLATGPGLIACTFASSKFAGRAPAGYALLRAFYRPGGSFPLERSEDAWTRRAAADLGQVLGLRAGAERSWVRRWPEAIPRFPADHVSRARALGERLGHMGPIEIAGATCCGVGIVRALESGIHAARRLLARTAR